MASLVNPPPQLRIPKAFLADREVRSFIEQQNTIIFQLWVKLGGNDDPISEIGNEGSTSFSPIIQQTIKRLNGLPKFTCDTTGFTADSTEWTADKDIA